MLLALLLAVHDPANPAQLAPLYERHLARLERPLPEERRIAESAAGRFYLSIGDRSSAARHLDKALALAETAGDLESLALARPERQQELYDRALTLRQKQPPVLDLAKLLGKIGEGLLAGGDNAGAIAHYRRALQVVEKLVAPADVRLATALADLAFALESTEQFAEAEPLYRRALGIQEKSLGPRHPEVGITLNNLAGVVGAQGRLARAEPLLRRALTVLEDSFGPDHPRVAACAANLGDLLGASGRGAAAAPLLRRALAIYEREGDREAAARTRESLERVSSPKRN